jgi:hypothetical protein
MVLSSAKYPMFYTGTNTSSERALANLVSYAVGRMGWGGVGLWIGGPSTATVANLEMLQRVGVTILKVDGGDGSCEITKLARVHAPDVLIEHGGCFGNCPLNGGISNHTGRWDTSAAVKQAKGASCSDLYRTYDMVKALSVSETLDRQSKLLVAYSQLQPAPTGDALRLFGGSGEHMVTAALGGVIQPMDSNSRGLDIPPTFSTYANGPTTRGRQHREDEIDRLVSWAGIAPPFGLGTTVGGGGEGGLVELVELDEEEVLWDTWHFGLCDDACTIHKNLTNKTVQQGASARVARGGLPLPAGTAHLYPIHYTDAPPLPVVEVPHGADKPFVAVTRFPPSASSPVGAVMVTALGRTNTSGWYEVKANVTLDMCSVSGVDELVRAIHSQAHSLGQGGHSGREVTGAGRSLGQGGHWGREVTGQGGEAGAAMRVV